jgi:hypothetical protein
MPVVTHHAVAKRLREAGNMADLDRVSNLIQFVPSITERESLAAIYKERAAELKPPQHDQPHHPLENLKCSN